MGTVIIYYSYTGHTKAIAQKAAAEEPGDLVEVRDVSLPGVLKAYTKGVVGAIKGKAWPMQPIDADLSSYARIVMLSPVWAGNMPPVMNNVLEMLPAGKAVAVKMVSASGKSKCRERLEAAITAKGCTMESFEDVKG
ncbi:MAG: flavodoxin domain-containing protein [Clostridiales bacterium]|nr:flavodoxin domain-containing protein [Clostridiales bacterium]